MRRSGLEKTTVGKTKKSRFLRHNLPKTRKFGRSVKKCGRCGTTRAHIDKYGLNLCRRCFREIATNIGFKKNR